MSKETITNEKMYEVARNLHTSYFNQTRLAIQLLLDSHKGQRFRFNPKPTIRDPYQIEQDNQRVTVNFMYGSNVELAYSNGTIIHESISRLSTDDILSLLSAVFETPSRGEWEDL